jgi:hypothetical protein
MSAADLLHEFHGSQRLAAAAARGMVVCQAVQLSQEGTCQPAKAIYLLSS